jgi:hypothetical protein
MGERASCLDEELFFIFSKKLLLLDTVAPVLL